MWELLTSPTILPPDVQEGAGRAIPASSSPPAQLASPWPLLLDVVFSVSLNEHHTQPLSEMWSNRLHPWLLFPFSSSFEPSWGTDQDLNHFYFPPGLGLTWTVV